MQSTSSSCALIPDLRDFCPGTRAVDREQFAGLAQIFAALDHHPSADCSRNLPPFRKFEEEMVSWPAQRTWLTVLPNLRGMVCIDVYE